MAGYGVCERSCPPPMVHSLCHVGGAPQPEPRAAESQELHMTVGSRAILVQLYCMGLPVAHATPGTWSQLYATVGWWGGNPMCWSQWPGFTPCHHMQLSGLGQKVGSEAEMAYWGSSFPSRPLGIACGGRGQGRPLVPLFRAFPLGVHESWELLMSYRECYAMEPV